MIIHTIRFFVDRVEIIETLLYKYTYTHICGMLIMKTEKHIERKEII